MSWSSTGARNAALLHADLLPILDSDARARIAADVAGRLEILGAYASAREAVT
jgi:hypothetical protein